MAISDAAGGGWSEIARHTAISLCAKTETKSFKAELLEEIQAIFERQLIDRISSVDLVSALCADEEAPWKTYNRGREITPKQLAGLLKGYDIISKTVRIGITTPKGYERSQFVESWARYTSVNSLDANLAFAATPPQVNEYMEQSVAATNLPISNKTLSATEKPIWNMGCGGVADKTLLSSDSLFDGQNFSREI